MFQTQAREITVEESADNPAMQTVWTEKNDTKGVWTCGCTQECVFKIKTKFT